MRLSTTPPPGRNGASRQPTTTKVIDVYGRLSVKKVDDDHTLKVTEVDVDSQVTECLERIEELRDGGLDCVVGEVFRDIAKSAWRRTVIRKEFNQLMARLESGVSHGVVVYDLSRFTRKPMEGERLIEACEKYGTMVISIENSYNLLDSDSRKHFRTDMADAAKESDKISQRTRRGKRRKANRGESNATSRGYAMDGLLPKPEGWKHGDARPRVSPEQLAFERSIAREVGKRLLAKEGPSKIARDLNDRGIRTVTGKRWDITSLKRVMERPSIAGLVEHDNHILEGKRLPDPVLDRDDWEAIQAMFETTPTGRPVTHYTLTGLLWCGRCGHWLKGNKRTAGLVYEDGTPKWYYRCNKSMSRPGPCGALAIDGRDADRLVATAVTERLSDPAVHEQYQARILQIVDEQAEVQEEIRRCEETLGSLADRLGADPIKFSLERHDRAALPIERRLEALQEKLKVLKADAPPDTDAMKAGRIGQVAVDWDAADTAGRRNLFRRAFRHGVTVVPSKGRFADPSEDRLDLENETRPTPTW